MSEKYYPPRGKNDDLIKELKTKNKFKATLGGTIIEKIHNSVLVYKEKEKTLNLPQFDTCLIYNNS